MYFMLFNCVVIEDAKCITGDIRTKLEELYHHYSNILRIEKAKDIQNLEDDLADYYLPAGIFDEFFIPRYFIFFYFTVMLEILLSTCISTGKVTGKECYCLTN